MTSIFLVYALTPFFFSLLEEFKEREGEKERGEGVGHLI